MLRCPMSIKIQSDPTRIDRNEKNNFPLSHTHIHLNNYTKAASTMFSDGDRFFFFLDSNPNEWLNLNIVSRISEICLHVQKGE
jgi:hypothetical protein